MTVAVLPHAPASWRHAAACALDWWIAELVGLLPAEARHQIKAWREPAMCLRIGRSEARLVRAGQDVLSPLCLDAAGSVANAAVRLRQFAGTEVAIEFDPELVYSGDIELPEAAENALAQILPHQLERLLPLDPAAGAFVWRIAERLPGRKSLRVRVSVVRRQSLDRARALAGALGLLPESIRVPQDAGPPSVIWSKAEFRAASRRRIRLLRGLEASALVLLLSGYFVYLHRLDLRAAALRRQVAAAERQLPNVRALALTAKSHQALLNRILDRAATPSALTVLNELSARVPLDAYVADFEYRPPRIELSGTAAHATALLTTLGESPLLETPAFVAPITAVPGTSGEHFEIVVNLRHGSR